MAKPLIDGTMILLAGAGATVGAYFTDCLGYCVGFKKSIDDFIGSILGTGYTPPDGCDKTEADCTAPQVLNTTTCACETPSGGNPVCTTNADCATGQICASGHCTSGGSITATPDKTYYTGSDTVVVTGAGFAAGETVDCRYTSGGTLVVGGAKSVNADASGGFTVSYPFAGGGHVTCTGRTSGRLAQAKVSSTAPAAYGRVMKSRMTTVGLSNFERVIIT